MLKFTSPRNGSNLSDMFIPGVFITVQKMFHALKLDRFRNVIHHSFTPICD